MKTMTTQEVEKILETNEIYVRAWLIEKDIFNKFDLAKVLEVIKHNQSMISEHGLYSSDVETYIDIQKRFENRINSTKTPCPCDMLEVWSNNDRIFYHNAHIEKCSYNDTGWTWVEHASSHYIDIDCYSTSGGAWHELDINNIEYVGKAEKVIWTWSHTGARGNGGLYIKVQVNKFKLVLDRKFIPFAVSRIYNDDTYKYKISKYDKIECCFHSYGDCFRTMSGLKRFLKNRGLKIGKKLNGWGCNHEIIGDYDNEQHMSKKTYDSERGDLKEFPFLSNGDYTTAFFKNGKVHYCNPNVKDRTILPYIHE